MGCRMVFDICHWSYTVSRVLSDALPRDQIPISCTMANLVSV